MDDVNVSPNTKSPDITMIPKKLKQFKKVHISSKESDKLIRPHYISTELSIRDKLFVGVLTSEDKVNSQAVYINKTIAHLVDKVKFFITIIMLFIMRILV